MKTIKTKDAIKFYGNKNRLARAFGISRQAVEKWGEYVPEGRHWQLIVMTGGKLS